MADHTEDALTEEYLKNKITKELEASFVSVKDVTECGCGMKFDAVIVSKKFEGVKLLQRHRMVNEIIKDEMIHAFTQKTLTPEEWEKQKSSS